MISLITDFRVAARNLRRARNRTTIAVLTVAGGLVAYMLAGGFIEWIFENMRESTIRSQLGHIQIVRPGYLDKGIADPYSYLLPSQSDDFRNISLNPNVVSLAQRVAFSGLVSLGESTVSFIGEGIEPEREAVISDQIHISSGTNLEKSDDRGVLLGEGLAKNLLASPGDRIVLLVTAANGTPNAIEVVVTGIFFTSVKEFDDVALRLPIKLARKLMRVDGASSWIVLLQDTAQTKQVAAKLSSVLSPADYEVVTWMDLADFYKKTVVLFGTQLSLIKAIIAIIIVLTISNTQTMNVLERTTEIGTMMALGYSRSAVLRIFVVEGILIGVFGGMTGVISGYAIAEVLSAIGIPMPPPPGMETGFTAEILISTWLSLDAFVLAVVTTLAASLMPAWKASNMNIVDALRCNQ